MILILSIWRLRYLSSQMASDLRFRLPSGRWRVDYVIHNMTTIDAPRCDRPSALIEMKFRLFPCIAWKKLCWIALAIFLRIIIFPTNFLFFLLIITFGIMQTHDSGSIISKLHFIRISIVIIILLVLRGGIIIIRVGKEYARGRRAGTNGQSHVLEPTGIPGTRPGQPVVGDHHALTQPPDPTAIAASALQSNPLACAQQRQDPA
mmetsp:Transcript_26376/g.56068  ORF Transcript_26376/g.56068 Transcript_26376/m.56068 type:complete len:205 (-) Transcript_26376:233-847(-)